MQIAQLDEAPVFASLLEVFLWSRLAGRRGEEGVPWFGLEEVVWNFWIDLDLLVRDSFPLVQDGWAATWGG